MNLFIQAVSDPGVLILFDDTRKIIDTISVSLSGKESANLLPQIEAFLRKNQVSFTDISQVVTVNGPGSFTGIRSIVLIVNTLSFVFPEISLTTLSYFYLFSQYPIVKQSSKKDVFVQFTKESLVEILLNEVFMEEAKKRGVSKVFGDIKGDLGAVSLENTIDYATIVKDLVFENKQRIDPLYIKKPNIS